MTDTTESPFHHLDFNEEQVQEADELIAARQGRQRDGRICTCGHPLTRHTVVNGTVYCKPSRMECPCKVTRAVLDVSDTRPFLRKTEGPGPLHALSRGMLAALRSGHRVAWLIEKKCDRCAAEGPVSPVPVTQRGVAVNHPTGHDALLCKTCREEV